MSENSLQIEEGEELRLDFSKLKKTASISEDVLPVAVQDSETGELLVVAYANQEALDYSLEHSIAAFWSTSRNELWVKGRTSGDILELKEIRVNCEQNSLLYIVKPKTGGVCHTINEKGKSRKSCYYRRIKSGRLEFLEK